MTKKKGITPIVTVSLLLLVAVVAFSSLYGWYGNFVTSFETKHFGDGVIAKAQVEGIKLENSSFYIYVKSYGGGYAIINSIKISNSSCTLPESNVILGETMSKIKIVCPAQISTVNDYVIITKSGVLQGKTFLS